MGKCNITSKELADALDITLNRLDDICEFFDSKPDDDWDLVKGVDYERGAYDSRIFSSDGAIKICNYLIANTKERSLLKRLKRWILQSDQKLKALMVGKKIEEIRIMPNQLIFIKERAFLSPRACRDIFGLGTRQDKLNNAFESIQSCENTELEVLKIDEDFMVSETKTRYFSRSGIASLGKQLEIQLTQEHRKFFVRVIADYAPKVLSAIEQDEVQKEIKIKKMMDKVKNQARKTCQITNKKQNIGKFDLEVHHLFDKKNHPQLADIEVNLIAIRADIHRDFHVWMGGSKVSCTVEDMEKYIKEFGNSLFDGNIEQATQVSDRLSKARKMLRALL